MDDCETFISVVICCCFLAWLFLYLAVSTPVVSSLLRTFQIVYIGYSQFLFSGFDWFSFISPTENVYFMFRCPFFFTTNFQLKWNPELTTRRRCSELVIRTHLGNKKHLSVTCSNISDDWSVCIQYQYIKAELSWASDLLSNINVLIPNPNVFRVKQKEKNLPCCSDTFGWDGMNVCQSGIWSL